MDAAFRSYTRAIRRWGAKRKAFRSAVQSRISSKFFFSHDVQVDITLFMDVQEVRETSDTADVDNYAKCILDALKGPNGIILEDSQVQSLSIAWLSKHKNKNPSFDVQIRNGADAFRLKPLSFYEMPNGLWYPFSKYLWTDGKAETCSELNLYAGLRIESLMTDALRKARHFAESSTPPALRRIGNRCLSSQAMSAGFTSPGSIVNFP